LIRFPQAYSKQALKHGPSPGNARKIEGSIAIGILLFAPIRLQNLRTLAYDRHFLRRRSDGEDRYEITIEADEVKNSRLLSHPLPSWLSNLIDLYRHTYQPCLFSGEPQSYLFAGRTGGAKSENCPSSYKLEHIVA
jgi:hypothetical protein